MNTTQKKVVASAVIAGAVVIGAIQYKNWSNQVVERFPNVEKKTARKAYRNMMLKAVTGQLTDAQMASDASMDAVFLQEVANLSKK